MTYTQMLFALTFDKFFFGHSPNWMSIVGSSLILGPAIFVAMQKNVDEPTAVNEGGRTTHDEEAQQGLISGMAGDDERDEDGRPMPVQEAQMRALR
jgi:hypothetical protein